MNATHDALWGTILLGGRASGCDDVLLLSAALVAHDGWVPSSAHPDAQPSLESTSLFLIATAERLRSRPDLLAELVPGRGRATLGLQVSAASRTLIHHVRTTRALIPSAEPYVSRRDGRCPLELYALVLAATAAVSHLAFHAVSLLVADPNFPPHEDTRQAQERVGLSLARSMGVCSPHPASAAHLLFFLSPSELSGAQRAELQGTLATASFAPLLFADLRQRTWLFELELAAQALLAAGVSQDALRLRKRLQGLAGAHAQAWVLPDGHGPQGPHVLTTAALAAAQSPG